MGYSTDGRRQRRERDIVLDRDDDGNVHITVPRTVRHYATDDLDWGYIGPATAELALNILNWILPPGVDGEPGIRCDEGECSAVAWRLHRTFMAEMLVRVPYAGGCLYEREVRRWVLRHFSEIGRETPAPAKTSWFSGFLPR